MKIAGDPTGKGQVMWPLARETRAKYRGEDRMLLEVFCCCFFFQKMFQLENT